jgi:serine/threonine protein kinase
MDDYNVLELIGEGSFGKVYKVSYQLLFLFLFRCLLLHTNKDSRSPIRGGENSQAKFWH